MSELKLSIQNRKFLRKSITEIYSNLGEFSALSRSEKLVKEMEIKEKSVLLTELDNKIQRLGWLTESTAKTDRELDEEFEACKSYKNKIRLCLVELSQTSQNMGGLQMQSEQSAKFMLVKTARTLQSLFVSLNK